MERIITGIFDTFDAAKEAAGEVKRFGLRAEDVQIISKRKHGDGDIPDVDHGYSDAMTNSTVVMMGLGSIDAPGYAYPMSAGMVGDGDDGDSGVSATKLIRQAGIPNDKGLDYENDIRKGRILWAVRASDDASDEIAEMLRHRGAAKVDVY